jgi:hypothetical protein
MSEQFVNPVVSEVEDVVDVDTIELVEVSDGDLPPEGPMEGESQSAKLVKISRHDVLVRAKSWIDEHVIYSQSHYHRNRYGRYRQDCSGYVSMCWHLPTSYTTATIMQVAHRISWSQLQAGDALWRRSGQAGHIALFVGYRSWDKAHTKPVVDEESRPGTACAAHAWSHEYASRFTPIRYNHIS